jgi:hypothetical protein
MAKSRYYPDIFLEGTRKSTKTSVRIAGVPADIRTANLENKSVDLYRYANPLS